MSVLPVVWLYWLLLWTYTFNIYQYQVQHHLPELSLAKAGEITLLEINIIGIQEKHLGNFRPSFNMRLLNTEQVA